MKEAVGSIKSISKNTVSVDENGDTKSLQAGDIIYLGDIIKNQANDEVVEIGLDRGDNIVINANNTLIIDKSVVTDESFGNECYISKSSFSQIAQIHEDFSTLLDDIIITQNNAVFLHAENYDAFTETSKGIIIEDSVQTDF